MDSAVDEISAHYQAVWRARPLERLNSLEAKRKDLPDQFRIEKHSPTAARNMWTYATCGMSLIAAEPRKELHIFAPWEHPFLVKLLSAVAHYHLTEAAIGVGHSVFFGCSWLPGSSCEYGLVSSPYLDGPQLESLTLQSGENIQFLWLIPITREEVAFKKKYGVDRLEELLESSEFNYLNPLRTSVV